VIAAAADDGHGVLGGGHLFAAALSVLVTDRARAELARFHKAQPIEPGMPREALRDAAAPGARPELFDVVLSTLVAAGEVKGTDRVALASHQMTLSADDQATRAAVEAAVVRAGLAALDAAGLAREAAQPRSAVDAVVRLLMREGRLVRVDTLLVSAVALDQLKSEIVDLGRQAGAEGATLDVAAFKSRYGLSRKHAIPLLEWLDRERVTNRVGTSGQRAIRSPS
jgi:selenocysteine-specific elongation factor